MRKPLLAANWKMNQTVSESLDWLADFNREIAGVLNNKDVDAVFCPPFTALYPLHQVIASQKMDICLGAQDLFWQ